MTKSTFILSMAAALLAGYGLGRMGGQPESGKPDEGGEKHETRSVGGFSGISAESDAGADASPRARRPRTDKPVQLPDPRRVSIPMSSVVPILKKQMFSYRDFMNLGDSMETALTMLGATDEEREQVRALVKDTQEKILREEKNHIKVEKADATGVKLDLTGMREIAEGIAGELQDGLRGALKPEAADALVESVDWKNFYAVQREGNPIVSEFALERGPGGGLMATHRYGNGSSSRHLQGPDMPQEGKPADVSKYFDQRWESYLKGVEMLPVDAPEP